MCIFAEVSAVLRKYVHLQRWVFSLNTIVIYDKHFVVLAIHARKDSIFLRRYDHGIFLYVIKIRVYIPSHFLVQCATYAKVRTSSYFAS